MINQRVSPIVDKEIEDILSEKKLNLTVTNNSKKGYHDADFVIISTSTNYDSELIYFNTTSIEAVLKIVRAVNSKAVMIIKSTIPVVVIQKK